MKTTLNISEDLLSEAMFVTNAKGKTEVIHLGLQELISKAARERLINLGGTYPKAKAPVRRRSK
jgi:hypothetical protein